MGQLHCILTERMMDMTPYSCMIAKELEQEFAAVQKEYDRVKALGLKLNMARGKPAKAQLDLVSDILTCLTTVEELEKAMEVLTICLKLAALEKLLGKNG